MLVSAIDYPKELWDLANQVTFLAIAQGLGFAIALGKDLAKLQSAPRRVKVGLSVASILFTVLYCIIAIRCCQMAVSAAQIIAPQKGVWLETTVWRCVAICLSTGGLTIFGLFAPEVFRRRSGGRKEGTGGESGSPS